MDLALNHRRRSILRPLLFAAFAGLAWLIWGAGTANAALPDPDLVPQLTQGGTTTLEDASAGATLPAPIHLPASTLLPIADAVVGTASPVTAPVADAVSGAVATTIPTVDAGLAEVVGVVGSAVGPVQPVVTDVGEIVGGVLDIVPGVVDGVVDVVPTAPLPGPDAAPPVLPEPVPSVPGVLSPGHEAPSDAQSSEVPATQPAAEEAANVLRQSSQSGIPATQFTDGTRTGQALLIPLALHTLAVMGDSAGSVPVPEAPAPGERHLQAALAAGPGSASTGSAGGGAQAWADVAAFWAVPLAASFAGMPSRQELPPVAPPFDPGSTPD
ncbi:hypothetical protein ACW0JT_01780 [Arthrobacter sp. SA17]